MEYKLCIMHSRICILTCNPVGVVFVVRNSKTNHALIASVVRNSNVNHAMIAPIARNSNVNPTGCA